MLALACDGDDGNGPDRPVASVLVAPPETTLVVGEATQLRAELRDANGNTLMNRQITWSTDENSVADVDQTGFVTALAEGIAVITASSEDIDGSSRITVLPETDLACGGLLQGSIDAAGEVDLITFAGQEDEVVLVTLVKTADFGGGAPRAIVLSPSATQLASFAANGQAQITLPETGSYVITIRDNVFVNTGSYNLGLEGISPVCPDAIPLNPGDLFSDSIVVPGDVDVFAFTGQADDVVLVTLAWTAGFSGGAPRAVVLSPSATQLASFAANGQAQITLPESGTYVITVRDNVFINTGSYNLGLEGISPSSPDAVILSFGDLSSDSLVAAGDVDVFTFSGQEGEVVLVTLARTAGFNGGAPRAIVLSPSATQLASFAANGQAQITLPETGTYVITVRDNVFLNTGSYNLGLERV